MDPMASVNSNSLNQGVGFFLSHVYVDMGDVVEKRILSMDCIHSEYYAGAYARKCVEMHGGVCGQAIAARGESAPQARARDLSADQGARTQPYRAIRRV